MRTGYVLSSRVGAAVAAAVLVATLAPSGAADAKGGPKVTACKGGKAASYTCKGIDLVAQVPAEVMGGARIADVWGWVDGKTKKEYAVLGSTRGIQFLDVSDPSKPVYLGSLAGSNA